MNLYNTGIMSLAVCANLFASSLVVSSDIATNTSWNTDTVFVNKAGFTVLSGTRLTIAPGTVVKFRNGLRFITVQGSITAAGTETDSIRFSEENSQLAWQGIRFLQRTQGGAGYDSSYLKFCVLEGSQCFFTDSLYMKRGCAVYCGPGNYLELSNSSLRKNMGYHGGSVYVDSGAIAVISNCSFENNTTDFYGGGAIMSSGNGTKKLRVLKCRFSNNYTRTGGAVYIGKGTEAGFDNCVFYRDTTLSINPGLGDLKGGAMAIFGPADVTLRNCIIFHCRSYEKGGGIYSSDASIKVINCTLAKNSSKYGGGIYFARDSAPSTPLIVNTIDGGNGKIPGVKMPRDSAGCGFFLDSSVTPIFRYCHLYDTVYDFKIKRYAGEFIGSNYYITDFAWQTVPRMPDTIAVGYTPDKNDSAIDGGTPDTTGLGLPELDVLGQKRINGGAVDIGAIEFHGQAVVARNRSAWIGKNPLMDIASGETGIFSLDGRRLGCFTGPITRAKNAFKVPKGVYFVKVQYPDRHARLEKVLVK
jgi:hypothetical protein